MSYILRRYDCADCGKPTERKRHPYDKMICVDCGVKRAEEAARDMGNKSGPNYRKWLAGLPRE